jgi:pimeloyl-ACP methyl ester carboxylesterase
LLRRVSAGNTPTVAEMTAGPRPQRAHSRFGTCSLFRQGSGHPVLVLHAAGGAGAWNPYLERLSAHFDVIAPDHPGFGNSPELPGVDTIADLVEHYVSLIDNLELERLDLVGASLGGWLAAEIACAIPERLDHLVLMAPPGMFIPDAPPADLFTMPPDEIVRALFWDGAKAEAMLATPLPPEAAAQAERDAAAFAKYAAEPLLHNPDLPSRLSCIRAPTLVITPEVDVVIPRAHSEAYAAAIDGAVLRVISRCGHALYFELPDLVADEVIAFLTDVPAATT